jgi:hypothetical protein
VNVVSGHYSNVRAGSPPVGSCRPAAGAEGQVRTADSVQVGTLRTSSTPSVQQPPTPPHTPKTTGNNNSTTTGQTAPMPLGLYIWFDLAIYFTSGVSCFDINQALTSRHCFFPLAVPPFVIMQAEPAIWTEPTSLRWRPCKRTCTPYWVTPNRRPPGNPGVPTILPMPIIVTCRPVNR